MKLDKKLGTPGAYFKNLITPPPLICVRSLISDAAKVEYQEGKKMLIIYLRFDQNLGFLKYRVFEQ